MELVGCVPNFSDGRDRDVLTEISDAVTSVEGVLLLDVHADSFHNRSVFTFVGPAGSIEDAAFRAVRAAARRIDVSRHRGEHPRMGAADVVPFVPVEGVTMDECVALANSLADRVGKELEIPVFLYACAASRPKRVSLPEIRKGEFEALTHSIGSDPEKTPDRGPNRIHPTAGAVAIGARRHLIAYNIYLDSDDRSIAEEIAAEIRSSAGGLPAVQARGFSVGGSAQVSMNLLDFTVTSPADAFDTVRVKAAERGVEIKKSEIVGLIPESAISDTDPRILKLDKPIESYLLEARIGDELRR